MRVLSEALSVAKAFPLGRRLRRGGAVLAAMGCLVACSAADVVPGPLCDGSTGIRLLYRNSGGGQIHPGSEVLSENGFNFLILDGKCHYWVRDAVDHETREGVLSEDDAQRTARTLRVVEWNALSGTYVDDLCDGPTREYRFDGAKIDVAARCNEPDTSAPVDWILGVATAEQVRLYGSGDALTGPMRYVLVSVPIDTFWPAWWMDNAVRWQTDLSAVALTSEEAANYKPGDSVLASAEESAMLRAARNSFLAKNGPRMTGGFIPFVDATGSRFEMYVRDVIPLEDGRGILSVD